MFYALQRKVKQYFWKDNNGMLV